MNKMNLGGAAKHGDKAEVKSIQATPISRYAGLGSGLELVKCGEIPLVILTMFSFGRFWGELVSSLVGNGTGPTRANGRGRRISDCPILQVAPNVSRSENYDVDEPVSRWHMVAAASFLPTRASHNS
jgi:hypothetical protein